jgi:hypothetical protein
LADAHGTNLNSNFLEEDSRESAKARSNELTTKNTKSTKKDKKENHGGDLFILFVFLVIFVVNFELLLSLRLCALA